MSEPETRHTTKRTSMWPPGHREVANLWPRHLMETAPGVSVADVIANTEAELVIPAEVPEMAISA